MLGGTGLVVTPRDSSGMARALLSLLKGEGAAAFRVELSRKALQRARSLYTLTHSMNSVRSQYEHISRNKATAEMLSGR